MDYVNAAFNDILAELDRDILRLTQAKGQGEPDVASELKYFTAQRKHYVKAQYHHLQGVRPVPTGTAWLVPSGSRPDQVHRVALVGGVHLCSCEAGTNGLPCWHTRLIEAIERGSELIDMHDDAPLTDAGDVLPPDDDAAYAPAFAALLAAA